MKDLFWLDTGTGRPLVLLHGGFMDHGMWDPQIPVFASRYRVIAPDARGHGRSANPIEPYRLTDDLAALLRHLNTGPAILVGVSMGAGIAVDTALEHPDLVSALVISGAGTSEPYFDDPWTTQALAAWRSAMASGDLDASVERFMLLAAGPHRTLDDLDPDVLSHLRRMTRTTMSKHTTDEPDLLVPVRDTWARAAGIEVPVLAVNGALDSPDHIGMAERLTRTVPNGHAISIDGAAHYPNLERPDAFNKIVEDFARDV
ncbi:pimeloyl-ACP methyl ester carboxylesterase [Thermocatellispora tengchongensis]|uniref:Pimeloyl-ACP methyl ester carboxylesterase n=1 Tax=Thermocatellispora tengchongensis TaxID=1073253 RepID=A0A840PPX8_9ACTN|nr:alpha/beta hydrolase [Thermocatellispora tengchongensis]MBB5138065.1 pimeloyl-ACP methyl ester carboxylesterase [Thermocatellispora tengchongensis]